MGLTQVSTDGVKNDAITKVKIPANQIEASELADNAVDTNAIANNAVTAGKLASGVQTTINNNADNRVITGSGTANTLNGEANFSYNGTNCLIGTSTGDPYGNRNLTVAQGGSGNTTVAIEVRSPTNGDGRLIFTDSTSSSDTGSYKGHIMYDQSNDFMQFSVNAAQEAMRIDSSKNILFGTTSNTIYDDTSGSGVVIRGATGALDVKRNSDHPLLLNRIGTDGVMMRLNKNGVNVGDISVRSSALAFDIGGTNAETVRFLSSGGITFNGDTATANALDDYEEGTWTPVVRASVNGTVLTHSTDYEFRSGSGTTNTVSYTKIGNRVFLSFSIYWNSSATNRYNISLPFAIAGSVYQVVSSPAWYGISVENLGMLGNSGHTFDTYRINDAGSHLNVPYTSSSEVYYNFQYQTT